MTLVLERTAEGGTVRRGALVVEAAAPPAPLPFEDAARWRALVTLEGVPVHYAALPSPGAGTTADTVEVVLHRHADAHAARERFIADFRRRMGAAMPEFRGRTVSVVVCTHRRPRRLPPLLEALARLDPAPDQVVIVDNDPGDEDCRGAAEAAGATYVREERRGLDRARTAGLAAATGELVAFTDDDCVPAATWLRALPELFDDTTVGAVTGPGFAYEIAGPAQAAFERAGGFTRGLQRRSVSWMDLSPLRATSLGAGANMIFRRDVLAAIVDPFPAELDAGTPTQSGGDLWALYKVMAAGHRITFDPGTYVHHQHREDWGEVHRAIEGYGIGMSAALAKALVEDGDWSALAAWCWLPSQYLRAVARHAAGRVDPVALRIAWGYCKGGFLGPLAWRRARRELGREPAAAAVAMPRGAAAGNGIHSRRLAGHGALPAPRAGGPAVVSVIIATANRRAVLARCLAAVLDEASRVPLEVIVAQDAEPGATPAVPLDPPPPGVRVVSTGGIGAAAARNAGAAAAQAPILLFLDDDTLPARGCVAAHLREHEGRADRVVIGYCPPSADREGLVGQSGALWWEDHYRRMRRMAAPTFLDVLSGNMSIRRDAFDRLGGFDARLGLRRREDWEFGVRVLRAKLDVRFASDAVAEHWLSVGMRERLAAARAEGGGHAALHARYPEVRGASTGVAGKLGRIRHPVRSAAMAIGGTDAAQRAAVALLARLEARGLRSLWRPLLVATQNAAYDRGWREHAALHWRSRQSDHLTVVELASDAAIVPPQAVTRGVELRVRGRIAGRFRPQAGSWDAGMADEAAAALDRRGWGELDLAPPRPVRSADLRMVTVVAPPGGDAHRQALEGAGARIDQSPRAAADYWRHAAACAAAVTDGIVVFPAPGSAPSARALEELPAVLAGERVVCCVGEAAPAWSSTAPVTLYAHEPGRPPYPMLGGAPDYLAVDAARLRRLGGVRAELAAFGWHAPVLDVVDRSCRAGLVVAQRAAPGLTPVASRSRPGVREARRRQARAALIARRALIGEDRGGWAWYLRWGVAPVVANVVTAALRGRRRLPLEAVHAVACLRGTARGLAHRHGAAA